MSNDGESVLEREFIETAMLLVDNMVDYCEHVKNAVARLRTDTIDVHKALVECEKAIFVKMEESAPKGVWDMEVPAETPQPSIYDDMNGIRSSDQSRLAEFQESIRHAANYSSIDAYCETSDIELAHFLMECLGVYMRSNSVGIYGKDQLANNRPPHPDARQGGFPITIEDEHGQRSGLFFPSE